MSGEPLVVDGHVIPPGTSVGVNLYSVMHNEEYFPRPLKFNPDRWRDVNNGICATSGEDNARAATIRCVFVTFFIGDRACVGKTLAYLEASVTIAKIVWYFDLAIAG